MLGFDCEVLTPPPMPHTMKQATSTTTEAGAPAFYTITLKHDAGTKAIRIYSSSADAAKAAVCKAELAPTSAVIRIARNLS